MVRNQAGAAFAASESEVEVLLACPACHGRLARIRDRISCRRCGAHYPIVDDIPLLLCDRAASRGDEHQIDFYDEEVDEAWEVVRPHGAPTFHGGLLEDKLRWSIAGLESLLPGAAAVTACGGSGMEAEFLARQGARVLSTDLSLGAARRARARAVRFSLPVLAVVADAERLPLSSRAVDIAYVHDGLHHLRDPHAGLCELARVANRAVSVTEPARAALTTLAGRLGAHRMGFALEVEKAGNRVARLTIDEVTGNLRSRGFDILDARRYAMIYRHEPGRPSRLFSRRRVLPLARAAGSVAGAALDPFGNKLTVQAVRACHSPRSSKDPSALAAAERLAVEPSAEGIGAEQGHGGPRSR